jgi:serine protease AprX
LSTARLRTRSASPAGSGLFGPLLSDVLQLVADPAPLGGFLATTSIGQMADASVAMSTAETTPIPVTALLPRRPPEKGEPWQAYRDDTLQRLGAWARRLEAIGLTPEPLISATGLRFDAEPDHLQQLEASADGIELIELDPLLEATALDEVPHDIDLPPFAEEHPDVDGTGVTVAVLDTGVDSEHPQLNVPQSFSTCDEPAEMPGKHATHCAGIIASQDDEYRGVAPGVRLINIKVGRANGLVQPRWVSRGFDRAADAGAGIISVSLGFNHRPLFSRGGHGWACSRGRMCQVCRSVDTAVRRGQLVVVAAGNEHDLAQEMRRAGDGKRLDTEICCPGQSTAAVTVGSISKRSWAPASSSSHGPSSTGARKPDIAAPGVNIMSTIPVPRGPDGRPLSDLSRGDIFARDSGTSMATPVVAGIAALLTQRMQQAGSTATPTALKRALVRYAQPLSSGRDIVGSGRAALP